MKQLADDLLTKLKCPLCAKGALIEDDDAQVTCSTCGRSYPIVNGIPDLLPESGNQRKEDKCS